MKVNYLSISVFDNYGVEIASVLDEFDQLMGIKHPCVFDLLVELFWA